MRAFSRGRASRALSTPARAASLSSCSDQPSIAAYCTVCVAARLLGKEGGRRRRRRRIFTPCHQTLTRRTPAQQQQNRATTNNNKTGRPRFRITSAQVLKRHVVLVRKNALLSTFYIKMIILPRQARDRHRESTQKSAVLCWAVVAIDCKIISI